ncbi:lactococcin 972 family bacteriocin [Nonomuraea sp. NPDC050404]|uniref:lactococcin 972 family bacteriocin n=1 Tax=Nonomuraea sp. NPDC050404 TaxID=3155783 RepID=UPI0033F36349
MRINRRVAAATGIVAGLTAISATSASATAGPAYTAASASVSAVTADQPKDGGRVAIPADPSSKATTRKTVNVGGGTWSYGTRVGTGGLKHCYSKYTHPKKKHSATAIMADVHSKDYAGKGKWASAGVTGGWAYTCYAYWNTY